MAQWAETTLKRVRDMPVGHVFGGVFDGAVGRAKFDARVHGRDLPVHEKSTFCLTDLFDERARTSRTPL